MFRTYYLRNTSDTGIIVPCLFCKELTAFVQVCMCSRVWSWGRLGLGNYSTICYCLWILLPQSSIGTRGHISNHTLTWGRIFREKYSLNLEKQEFSRKKISMIWGLWAILELWKRVFKIRKIIFDWCVKCGIYTTNLPQCPVCAFMPKWVFFNYQHFHLKHTKLISWKKWYFDITVLGQDTTAN